MYNMMIKLSEIIKAYFKRQHLILTNMSKYTEPYTRQFPERYISRGGKRSKNKIVICLSDGISLNAGLCDRLRGILSMYQLCVKYNLPFRIYWDYPFELSDYLIPNKYDWRIAKSELSFDSDVTKPMVICSVVGLDRQKFIDAKIFKRCVVKGKYSQYHIYTNSIIDEKKYRDSFDTLFRLSPKLESAIANEKIALGSKYFSVSARFMELLGDFKDVGIIKHSLVEIQQQELIERCYLKLSELLESYTDDYKAFVASDSRKFLERAAQNPRVHIVQGDIVHIKNKGTEESYMKTFVDLMLIRDAETKYLLKTGEMYASGFPVFASWIGNGRFKTIQF